MDHDVSVELILPTNLWRSQGDEDAFFNWMYAIDGYVTCRGIGEKLFLYFSLETVTKTGLLELMALFKRYQVPDLKQLRALEKSAVGNWFSSPDASWYQDIFR